MAEVIPSGGRIDTIEMNIRYQKIAQENFQKFGFDDRIQLIKANAREEITKLNKIYDLIYLDADKLYYQHYFSLDYCIRVELTTRELDMPLTKALLPVTIYTMTVRP